MVGPSNASNRFGPSSYVVGIPANGLGNGVNFTSIQAAVNQAVADGFGALNPCTIILRTGVYVEDVTITNGGIHLCGSDDAKYNLVGMGTIINGSLTMNITALNNFLISNIHLQASTAPALSITGAVIPVRFGANNCAFEAAGFPAVSFTNVSGTFGLAIFSDCVFVSDLEGIFSDARTITSLVNCNVTGNTNAITLDGSSRINFQYSALLGAAGFGVQFLAAANQCICRYSSVLSTDSAIDMTPGGVSEVMESVFDSSAPSGFMIAGTGNLEYCDLINEGTAIDLDPGLGVITLNDWKPYASTTNVGVSRYNPLQFSVNATNGEVSSLGSASFTWISTAVSIANMAIFTGYIAATPGGALTFGLPAVSALGDIVRLTLRGATSWQITQAAGQQVIVGSTQTSVGAGGSITSTANGDSIELVCTIANTTWQMISSVGNFVII